MYFYPLIIRLLNTETSFIRMKFLPSPLLGFGIGPKVSHLNMAIPNSFSGSSGISPCAMEEAGGHFPLKVPDNAFEITVLGNRVIFDPVCFSMGMIAASLMIVLIVGLLTCVKRCRKTATIPERQPLNKATAFEEIL